MPGVSMREITIELDIWAIWNAKTIDDDYFIALMNISPMDFFKKNKKECLARWKEICKAQPKIMKSDCCCEDEIKKLPNSFRVSDKTPQRLWQCRIHGKRFQDLA